tara:strand:- start:348 stop:857 length:510 start_codon:yes stop_codon:yes gene_type:complete
MTNEIINRVANSGLITIDLANYAPNIEILELDLKQFLFDGLILKEKDFRASLKGFNFIDYENKTTAVFCSANCIIPMWAFMLVASHLKNVTSEIYYGNKESVFQKLFLNNIESLNAFEFKNKKVIVKGCGQIPVSESLYIAITKKLKNRVTSLMFGEACSAVPVYKKKI